MTDTRITYATTPARSYHTAPGDQRDGKRYVVYVDGVRIGVVYTYSSPSRPTVGRHLGALRGYSRQWRAELATDPGHVAGSGDTRQGAVREMLRTLRTGGR
jgi:hypothetical protein